MRQEANSCHPELDSGSGCFNKGFTLLELLIAVIIIAILVLVAWPQYKHAVLKSRYSALLPVAQHLKTAQEAYYIGNDYYSDDLSTLDLDVPGTITSATTATYGDNMKAQISSQADEEEEYSYVLASKEGLNNNYIMYQEHSKNYPGEIHCEAKNGDSYAQWLCEKGLSGQKLEQGSITPGYTTYVLSGTGNGTFLKECTEEKELEDSSCECGKRTRTTTGCDEKTGEWRYGEWSSCPVKPEETKACSAIDPKWTSGTATRESQCNGSSWTEPQWDETACEIACKEEEKETTKACTCGTQTAGTVTCNTKTGKWEYSNWSECPEKPKEELDCDNGVDAKMTRTVTCQDNAWTEPTWDKHLCCNPNDTNKPSDQYICHDHDSNTCGIKTRSVTCNSNGQWVADDNAWQGNCVSKPADESIACGGDYVGNKTRPATCKADNTAWEYTGDYIMTTCCNNSQKTETRICSSGCGKENRTASTCDNGTWTGWSSWTGNCPSKPADEQEYCPNGYVGKDTLTYQCNASQTGWEAVAQYTCRSANPGDTFNGEYNFCQSDENLSCSGYTFANGSHCWAYFQDNTCHNNTYKSGSVCTGNSSSRNNICVGGTYTGKDSYCYGYNSTQCTGATYSSGAACSSQGVGACSGNTFNSGSYCSAHYEGTCSNNIYKGTACCRGSHCPSGSPKCNSSYVWDGKTYWP